ncbi:MAG: hypothetical protein IH595_15030 [Bacteroidales bacterium]|nr:hypothetical protein [Bacteroidales bacterium]
MDTIQIKLPSEWDFTGKSGYIDYQFFYTNLRGAHWKLLIKLIISTVKKFINH